jgi:phytoene dehydrogenase-like protein
MRMKQDRQKVLIIGGGVAGLCAGVYAQSCGYETQILEMHDAPGGLATSWQRNGYTFETCLHWLLGSNPASDWYGRWLEVFDIDKLKFIYPEEFVRIETEHGECLRIYSEVERLEAEMLQQAPEDAHQVRDFTSAIRSLCHFKMPDPTAAWTSNWGTLLRDVPYLPLLRALSRVSAQEYGERFSNPLLRAFFGNGAAAQMSALPLAFSLAWMSLRNAGYPIGGSQPLIQLICERFAQLGGRLRLGTKVERILVTQDRAVGVRLLNGERIEADWVISAADRHATIHRLLGSQYRDEVTEKTYEDLEPYPSYLQVSLGVAKNLSQEPGFMIRLLDAPIQVDPGTGLSQVSFRTFHFDPTFAPAGKTAVTCFLPTRNFEYWVHLKEHDPAAYQAEKQRIGEAVIAILERKITDLRLAIEVIDISTPATVIRYTGNWKGSMEGWLLTPGRAYRPLENALPGLERFLMVGHWIMPGGGLPSGLITARSAVQTICEEDGIPFNPQQRDPAPAPA